MTIEIEVSKLFPHPKNAEIYGDSLSTPEGVESLRRNKVISPLIVLPCDDLYVVISGCSRLANAKAAGLHTVPCVIREDLVDVDRWRILEILVDANCQREKTPEMIRREIEVLDVAAKERARIRQAANLNTPESRLAPIGANSKGKSSDEVARVVGVSQRTVERLRSVTGSIQAIQEKAATGEIAESTAIAAIDSVKQATEKSANAGVQAGKQALAAIAPPKEVAAEPEPALPTVTGEYGDEATYRRRKIDEQFRKIASPDKYLRDAYEAAIVEDADDIDIHYFYDVLITELEDRLDELQPPSTTEERVEAIRKIGTSLDVPDLNEDDLVDSVMDVITHQCLQVAMLSRLTETQTGSNDLYWAARQTVRLVDEVTKEPIMDVPRAVHLGWLMLALSISCDKLDPVKLMDAMRKTILDRFAKDIERAGAK